jgi:hypothetical protein
MTGGAFEHLSVAREAVSKNVDAKISDRARLADHPSADKDWPDEGCAGDPAPGTLAALAPLLIFSGLPKRYGMREQMRRLAAVLLAVVLEASSAIAAPAPDNADKSRVILLLVVADPQAKDGIQRWIFWFKNNVRSLLEDFASGGSSAASGMSVDVVTEDVNEPAKPNVLEASFARQPSLQVLSTVATFVPAGRSTLVDNEIYLGDFKGSLATPYVHFAQSILPGDYEITREALAAVTLYAYAMAIAKASPGSRFAVCQALDQANMYRNGVLEPKARARLENLFGAISTELEARACGGKK